MKKIVIKTSWPVPDYSLIALLKKLFPDCEIQVLTEDFEIFDYNDFIINRKTTLCENRLAALPCTTFENSNKDAG